MLGGADNRDEENGSRGRVGAGAEQRAVPGLTPCRLSLERIGLERQETGEQKLFGSQAGGDKATARCPYTTTRMTEVNTGHGEHWGGNEAPLAVRSCRGTMQSLWKSQSLTGNVTTDLPYDSATPPLYI